MLSRWHPHAKENRYVNQLNNIADAQITVVWDDDKLRGTEWARELGVDFEENLDKLLQRDDVDGVCITAQNDLHKDIIIKAAKAGKHIFMEKPLVMNIDEAKEVKDVVERAGVEVGVVFTRKGDKTYAYAKKLYDSGAMGEVGLLRSRVAVTNAAPLSDEWFKKEPIGNGGAIRDLGCHSIDIACWILGEPESVNVMCGYTRNYEVEDTGVCNIKFKNGAVAVLDSTFCAPLGHPFTFEIYGSKMAYLVDNENVTMIIANGEIPAEKKVIKIADIEDAYPIPLEQWINACMGKGENVCNLEAGIMVTRVLDAVAEAQEKNCTVNI